MDDPYIHMPKLSFEPVMATGAGIRFPRKNKKTGCKSTHPAGTLFLQPVNHAVSPV